MESNERLSEKSRRAVAWFQSLGVPIDEIIEEIAEPYKVELSNGLERKVGDLLDEMRVQMFERVEKYQRVNDERLDDKIRNSIDLSLCILTYAAWSNTAAAKGHRNVYDYLARDR
jgi:hypothetical protein